MNWHDVKMPPPIEWCSKEYPDDNLELRILVIVKDNNEPQKGTYRPHSLTRKFSADGFLGDYEITHWTEMPVLP